MINLYSFDIFNNNFVYFLFIKLLMIFFYYVIDKSNQYEQSVIFIFVRLIVLNIRNSLLRIIYINCFN